MSAQTSLFCRTRGVSQAPRVGCLYVVPDAQDELTDRFVCREARYRDGTLHRVVVRYPAGRILTLTPDQWFALSQRAEPKETRRP